MPNRNTPFFRRMIDALVTKSGTQPLRVLDFGCGKGEMVQDFLDSGFDAHGVDIGVDWEDEPGAWDRPKPAARFDNGERLRALVASPYRIPYDDSYFDVVVSNQVLEHAANKDEVISELLRVLKPGGVSIHLFPAKWRPLEPHLFVPLIGPLWPHIPAWWVKFWAFVGIRNEFQKTMKWQEVAAVNQAFCRTGVHYWRKAQFRDAVAKAGGRYEDLAILRQQCGTGRVSRALSRLPLFAADIARLRGVIEMACIAIGKEKAPAT